MKPLTYKAQAPLAMEASFISFHERTALQIMYNKRRESDRKKGTVVVYMHSRERRKREPGRIAYSLVLGCKNEICCLQCSFHCLWERERERGNAICNNMSLSYFCNMIYTFIFIYDMVLYFILIYQSIVLYFDKMILLNLQDMH